MKLESESESHTQKYGIRITHFGVVIKIPIDLFSGRIGRGVCDNFRRSQNDRKSIFIAFLSDSFLNVCQKNSKMAPKVPFSKFFRTSIVWFMKLLSAKKCVSGPSFGLGTSYSISEIVISKFIATLSSKKAQTFSPTKKIEGATILQSLENFK